VNAMQKWIDENRNKAKYKDEEKLIAACASYFRRGRAVVAAFIRGEIDNPFGNNKVARGNGVASSNGHSHNKNKVGFSRTEFRSKCDPETRIRETIRATLARLDQDPEKRDDVWPEADFRTTLCALRGLPVREWQQIIDDAEFLKYQFVLNKKRYWALLHTMKEFVFKEMPLAQEVEL
jgi:hypothetical protein